MKKLFLFCGLLFAATNLFSQNLQWTWKGGDTSQLVYARMRYGIKGVPDTTNFPGTRDGACEWTDKEGNLWLFGGSATTVSGVSGNRNDLWKYTVDDGSWTWISGDSSLNAFGVYGKKMVSSALNQPGARSGAFSWIDNEGDLWIFGGSGNTALRSGNLNDLWKYSRSNSQWTWINGNDTLVNEAGRYGTRGIAGPMNLPGGRGDGVSWVDPGGKLWLFGGSGFGGLNMGRVYMNDLWRLDPANSEWTWMNGEQSYSYGDFGTKGISSATNQPPGRFGGNAWSDEKGNFYLFGGLGYSQSGFSGWGMFNDMWIYQLSSGQWTWLSGDQTVTGGAIFGEKGIGVSANKPAGRFRSASWKDKEGNLYIFGGENRDNFTLNDLWKFTPATAIWTWVNGDSTFYPAGLYGAKKVFHPDNRPGARGNAAAWTDAKGNFWLLGGTGSRNTFGNARNDFWQYETANNKWAWLAGDTLLTPLVGLYGQKMVPGANNRPGAREFAVTWQDNSGNLWLYGGAGSGAAGKGGLNDLWKYDTKSEQWTWMNGTNTINQQGFWGQKGSGSSKTNPGYRTLSSAFTDAAGDLWLFGGSTLNLTLTEGGYMNDIWKYSVARNEWIWIAGDSTVNSRAIFGTRNVASAANKPGGRSGSGATFDANGDIWIFGGNGRTTGLTGGLNDLWKYSLVTGQWTWIGGSTNTDAKTAYGSQGLASDFAIPGFRTLHTMWSDKLGSLWIFGGYGLDATENGYLNDVWRYDPVTNRWTWFNGAKTVNSPGSQVRLGVAGGNPGARAYFSSSIDKEKNLWIFGGSAYSPFGRGSANDLWKYSTERREWTRLYSDSVTFLNSVYGTLNTPSPSNKPGSRKGHAGWVDDESNFWLFSGNTDYNSGPSRDLNDLWKFGLVQVALPAKLGQFAGALESNIVKLQWNSLTESNLESYIVERSSNGREFDSIGTVKPTKNIGAKYYSFADSQPSAPLSFYRLRMTDHDATITYSKSIFIQVSVSIPGIQLLNNPVSDFLKIRIQSGMDQGGSIVITDLFGRKIKTENIRILKGNSEHHVLVSGVTTGTYVVTVKAGEHTMARKFIKR